LSTKEAAEETWIFMKIGVWSHSLLKGVTFLFFKFIDRFLDEIFCGTSKCNAASAYAFRESQCCKIRVLLREVN
jgi:hypothetical protein